VRTGWRQLGIHTGADLRAKDIAFLRDHFGALADYLYRAARGIDLRRVEANRPRKSLGGERTFARAALREALAAAFGDWRQPAAGPSRYARAPQPLTPVAPERFVVRTPDKQRANLQAQLALPLNDQDADQPAVLVGNYILGSSAASRLWVRVREKEGLSYDVRSFISWNPVDRNSTWTATAIFAPENQPKVEAAMKEEISRLLREGVSAQELAQAQQALLNQRRLSRAQDAVVAGAWQFNLEHGRSFAQSRKLDDQIAALTVEQVNTALRRHLDPARIVWAWAGDFKQP